ncbi:cobalamin biosynthesis protein [Pararhizobium gei]|uniref:cobalamin biosynthesis protein n=1 Tax=Pararhizobium gei TaxID=1395951 RepID=UPI0030841B91
MQSQSGDPARHTIFALGLGCERGTPGDELIRLAEAAMEAAGIGRQALSCIASLDVRAAEPAMMAAAEYFAVPFEVFDAAKLAAEKDKLQTPSDIVFALTGCHGVAEAAALAAAGGSSRLVVPKIKSARATVAIAQGDVYGWDQRFAAGFDERESRSSQSDSGRWQAISPETAS